MKGAFSSWSEGPSARYRVLCKHKIAQCVHKKLPDIDRPTRSSAKRISDKIAKRAVSCTSAFDFQISQALSCYYHVYVFINWQGRQQPEDLCLGLIYTRFHFSLLLLRSSMLPQQLVHCLEVMRMRNLSLHIFIISPLSTKLFSEIPQLEQSYYALQELLDLGSQHRTLMEGYVFGMQTWHGLCISAGQVR